MSGRSGENGIVIRRLPVALLPALFLLLLVEAGRQRQPPMARSGGQLVVSQRSEPRTLNPLLALDEPSLSVLRLLHGHLAGLNAAEQRLDPELAESWEVMPGGRIIRVKLRPDGRFSDGSPLTVEDVLFSFRIFQDPKLASGQAESLRVGGQPLEARQTGPHSLEFRTATPTALGARLLQNVPILPSRRLAGAERQGALADVWKLGAAPAEIAGAGPFRLKEYVPGLRLELARNPHYWRRDERGETLPYLDRLLILFTGSEDAELARFLAGDTDVISGIRPNALNLIRQLEQKGRVRIHDVGPDLSYNFLLFNLNPDRAPPDPALAIRQGWFRDTRFRRALSMAADRDAIVRVVYRGRGAPLATHVSPGNHAWRHLRLDPPARSVSSAQALLAEAGFRRVRGRLLDSAGHPVRFTILASTSNRQRQQMAEILKEDFRALGIEAAVVSLEFRTFVARLLEKRDFDTAVMGLGAGDTDPVTDVNVWTIAGKTHLWNLSGQPVAAWESEMDALLLQIMNELDETVRRSLYWKFQELEAAHVPIIPLAAPNLLAAGKQGLTGFRPAVLSRNSLWNVETLFWSMTSR
mgnify:CR=1 FL=1